MYSVISHFIILEDVGEIYLHFNKEWMHLYSKGFKLDGKLKKTNNNRISVIRKKKRMIKEQEMAFILLKLEG